MNRTLLALAPFLLALLLLGCQEQASAPTARVATVAPTSVSPTPEPAVPTAVPIPTFAPTEIPRVAPTLSLVAMPTPEPTGAPVSATAPTPSPVAASVPTLNATATPTAVPTDTPSPTPSPTPAPTPALEPDPLSGPIVKGDSQKFRTVSEGNGPLIVSAQSGRIDFKLFDYALNCSVPRYSIRVTGEFYARWCQAGQITLSVADNATGASQEYSLDVVTPTPAPTATPLPTPTPRSPLPTSTPTPTPEIGGDDAIDPSDLGAIRRLSWVRDGIEGDELEGANALISLSRTANRNTWDALMQRQWLRDGLNTDEIQAVWHLRVIARRSETAAQVIVNMPFLETIEPGDVLALETLGKSAYAGGPLWDFLDQPVIRDGITDEEASLVATLMGVAEVNPDLVDQLLQPDTVAVETRNTELPVAGKVVLAVMRTVPGSPLTMDILEAALYTVEEFMSLPFPERHINHLIEDATRHTFSGTYFGSHIATLPVFEETRLLASRAPSLYAHELAHYYWTGNETWIDEGAASFMELIHANRVNGAEVIPKRNACRYGNTIKEIKAINPVAGEDEAFWCYYSLGERLFQDLYHNMDDVAFRTAFRRLYLMSLFDDPEDNCEGTRLEVCHVVAAFTTDVPADMATKAQQVINRWYGDWRLPGTESENPYTETAVKGIYESPYLGYTMTVPPDWKLTEETKTDTRLELVSGHDRVTIRVRKLKPDQHLSDVVDQRLISWNNLTSRWDRSEVVSSERKSVDGLESHWLRYHGHKSPRFCAIVVIVRVMVVSYEDRRHSVVITAYVCNGREPWKTDVERIEDVERMLMSFKP